MTKRGSRFYYWLRRQGYPEGYQTLCMNCQWIKRSETTNMLAMKVIEDKE